MTTALTEHTLFRPIATKSTLKADITNENARAIIRSEAEHRLAKTARLRAAGLEVASFLPPVKLDVVKRTSSSGAKRPAIGKGKNIRSDD
jgi:hypothetical protein